MSDLIPDEERESAITEAYNTITGNGEVEWGPETTQEALEKLWDRARLVSPVTREALGRTVLDAIEATRQLDVEDETTRQIASQIADAVLALLSVSPPAEVETRTEYKKAEDI